MDTNNYKPSIVGSVSATRVAILLREQGFDVGSVEFTDNDWDHVTGFVVRNERGVATGHGSVLVVCDHTADEITIDIHIGHVHPL